MIWKHISLFMLRVKMVRKTWARSGTLFILVFRQNFFLRESSSGFPYHLYTHLSYYYYYTCCIKSWQDFRIDPVRNLNFSCFLKLGTWIKPQILRWIFLSNSVCTFHLCQSLSHILCQYFSGKVFSNLMNLCVYFESSCNVFHLRHNTQTDVM